MTYWLLNVGQDRAPERVCRKALVLRARLGVLLERMDRLMDKITNTTTSGPHERGSTEGDERGTGTP